VLTRRRPARRLSKVKKPTAPTERREMGFSLFTFPFPYSIPYTFPFAFPNADKEPGTGTGTGTCTGRSAPQDLE